MMKTLLKINTVFALSASNLIAAPVEVDTSTQPKTFHVKNARPMGKQQWSNHGLNLQADNNILGGDIVAYRIMWGRDKRWSQWYVPGKNDVDHKANVNGKVKLRRMWSYFEDHTHEYIIFKKLTPKKSIVQKPKAPEPILPNKQGIDLLNDQIEKCNYLQLMRAIPLGDAGKIAQYEYQISKIGGNIFYYAHDGYQKNEGNQIFETFKSFKFEKLNEADNEKEFHASFCFYWKTGRFGKGQPRNQLLVDFKTLEARHYIGEKLMLKASLKPEFKPTNDLFFKVTDPLLSDGKGSYISKRDMKAMNAYQGDKVGSLPAIFKGIKGLTIYKGLIHQRQNDKLLKQIVAGNHFLHEKFHFSTNKCTIKAADLPKFIETISKGSFRRGAGMKNCGGFHPDYLLVWKNGDTTHRLQLCYGCGEMRYFENEKYIYWLDMSEGMNSVKAMLDKAVAQK